MAFEFLDKILSLVPHIRKPGHPLTFREKVQWTGLVMAVYFTLFSTPAFGVSKATLQQSYVQLLNIIFAARTGTLITVGIGPIVLASITLQLLQGAGILHIDMNSPKEKGRFQSIQKSIAIIIAIVEAFVFAPSVIQPTSPLYHLVVLQFALGAIMVIYLDEMMVKYGLTSGINLFIAGGVAFSIIAGTLNILVPGAVQALQGGGATAIPNAILAFGPLFFAVIVMLISIYAYDIKVELPLAFSQFRGVGGRLPISLLYVSVLPVILSTSLIVSMTVWGAFFTNVSGPAAGFLHFIAYYQKTVNTQTNATSSNLVGGILYLISPNFPLPYQSPYGIGGYPQYVNYLINHTSPLYLPTGGLINVPEWVHVITYILVLVGMCVLFGTFWIEMTGQSPKKVAEQLQSVGWQIPGFRRDPRIIENVLDKYIPTITVLGSIFVGLLAALATLSGAIGTGMGILLTVGIMYMLYQQLERENQLEGMPGLNKLLS